MSRDEIIAAAAKLLDLPVADVRLDDPIYDPYADYQTPRYSIVARKQHPWSQLPEWGVVVSSRFSHVAALNELRAEVSRRPKAVAP